MRASRSPGSAPRTSPVVAMAPALTIGLRGVLRSGWRRIELNASPEGSTPTTAATASRPRSSSAMP